MELLELMKHRRSIRRYEDRQISREDLEKVIRAGLFAPSAGGGQRSLIAAVYNPALAEKIGRLNVACMDRSRLMGSHVSAEQPSNIDDPTIQSGFYGAPTVCIIFAQKNFLYTSISPWGDREARTRNPYLRTVQDNMEQIVTHFKQKGHSGTEYQSKDK